MFGTGLSDPQRPSMVADTKPNKNILDVCSVDGIVAKLMAALYGNTDEFLASVGTIRCAIAEHWWHTVRGFCRYRACILADDRMIHGVSHNFGRSPLHHGCAFAILRVRGSLDPCVRCCSVSMDDDLPESECKHDTEITMSEKTRASTRRGDAKAGSRGKLPQLRGKARMLAGAATSKSSPNRDSTGVVSLRAACSEQRYHHYQAWHVRDKNLLEVTRWAYVHAEPHPAESFLTIMADAPAQHFRGVETSMAA